MSKKERQDRFKARACDIYKEKILALSRLESEIQKLIMEYQEEYGVKILDVQIYDPGTGEIQFETDI